MIRVCCLGDHHRAVPLTLAIVLLGSWQVAAQPANDSSTAASAAEAQQRSSPEALADYAKAANFQNNEAFDLAADAWQAFLQKHGQDPKAIDARYQLGACQLQLKKYPQARQVLQAVIDSKTPFDRREDAYLNLGWTLYSLALRNQPELFTQADQTFAALLQEFPEGQYRDQALFFRGESLYLQAKRDEAAAAYQQVVDKFPKSDLRDDSIYALGVTFEELGRFEEAGRLYDLFLGEFTEHELLPEVQMRKAETILRSRDFAEAARRFAEVAAIAGFKAADHALYRQAFCAARLQKFEEAGNLFAQITREFPNSDYRADATLSAARSYFRADKFQLAAEWFDKVLAAQDPQAAEAAHWRARLFLKQDQPQAALKLIEQYLPLAQEHPFFVNLKMDQADAIYELPERRAESIPLYAKLVKEHLEHLLAPQALYNAAFAALQLKQYEQGLAYAQQFLKHKDFAAHILLPDVKHVAAECQLQLGHSQAAAEIFAELARSNANRQESKKWQIRQALALYVQKKHRETVELLQAIVESLENPDDSAEAYYLMGMSHFGLEEYPQARDALQKSLEMQPNWQQADETLLNLSRAQRQLSEYDQAKQSIEQLFRRFPQSAVLDQASFRLAEYAYAQDDYASAKEYHSRVISKWPQSSFVSYALYGRGWASLRLEQLDPADADFSRLIDDYPGSPLVRQAYYGRALVRQQAGRHEASLADVQHFLQQDPSRQEKSDALYIQGLDQVGLGQAEQAIATFELIVQEDPGYSGLDKTLYELAWTLKNNEQLESATAAFARLVQQRSDSPLAAEAFYHVGEEAYGRGEFESAAQNYESALNQVGDNVELSEKVCYKLGWARYQLQDYEAAAAAFQKQLQQQPDGTLAGDGYFMQGECQFKLQNYQLALGSFKEATTRRLSSQQMDLLARLHGGQTAGQLGQWKESLQWLQAVPQKHPDSPYLPQVLYETGVAQQKLGDLDQAVQLFVKAADQATGELSAQARFMVGEVLYAKKDYAAAIREFRKVLFGFDSQASAEIQRWQAKAGLEAGQCAGILASQQADPVERRRLVDLARQLLRQVQTRYPSSEEAAAATEQLRRLRG